MSSPQNQYKPISPNGFMECSGISLTEILVPNSLTTYSPPEMAGITSLLFQNWKWSLTSPQVPMAPDRGIEDLITS